MPWRVPGVGSCQDGEAVIVVVPIHLEIGNSEAALYILSYLLTIVSY